MPNPLQINIDPDFIDNKDYIRSIIVNELKLNSQSHLIDFKILRRSIDARYERPQYNLKIEVFIDENRFSEEQKFSGKYTFISSKNPVLIIGAGPAGYFAALELIELGLKPIVLERGKDVWSRRDDLINIEKMGSVDPNSNFCFGEGGAGAYSDGKLYTRATKRGDIFKIFKLLTEHGASNDILIDSHPHIGSDKLPIVVKKIRETILKFGGEIYFNTCVTDFIIEDGAIKGVISADGKEFAGRGVILATGHSARDIFELLHKRQILIEAKPFALGVRVEHPQALIDKILYHHSPRHKNLPAASYRFACQVENRGVFSFCMCPGGHIVPAATSTGELVVNGMSLSDRSSPYANSGVVVEIKIEDTREFNKEGPLCSLFFQKSVEKKCFEAGGNNLIAPAQRMIDFVDGKLSSDLPATSYMRGVKSAPVHMILPYQVSKRLQKGFTEASKKLKGYYTNEAVVLAVESRTSSPVRIPRDKETYMHPQIKGLYPCGEGAGYSGGIVSSAMDGQKVARKIAQQI